MQDESSKLLGADSLASVLEGEGSKIIKPHELSPRSLEGQGAQSGNEGWGGERVLWGCCTYIGLF